MGVHVGDGAHKVLKMEIGDWMRLHSKQTSSCRQRVPSASGVFLLSLPPQFPLSKLNDANNPLKMERIGLKTYVASGKSGSLL